MDGQGYPRRLQAAQMSVEERVLALADVFEALTAADRPYKSAKTISESLMIMAKMCQENHLDRTLFIYFVQSRLLLDYAQQFIPPHQVDEVDIDAVVRTAKANHT
jgi:HD-GYP domain-containing protein (c-di-GMP phosphodiesterase class II)